MNSVLISIFRSAVVVALLAWMSGALAAPAGGDAQVQALRGLETQVSALMTDAAGQSDAGASEANADLARSLQTQAEEIRTALEVPVAQIDERIAQLGEDADQSADADVKRQHAALMEERNRAVALTRRAALVQVEAQQVGARLAEQQARALGEALMERSTSPIDPSVWTDAIASLPRDMARVPGARAANDTSRSALPVALALAVAWIVLSLVLLRYVARPLRELGLKVAARLGDREPRFSRTFLAVWWVIFGTVITLLSAWLFIRALSWSGANPTTIALISALATGTVFACYVHTLVVAVLQPDRELVRAVPVTTEAARLAAHAGNALAFGMGAIVAATSLEAGFELSVESQLGLHAALALTTVGSLALAFHFLWRMRGLVEDPARQARLALVLGFCWMGTGALVILGALGYIALAYRVALWATWSIVVALTGLVVMALVDGVCRLIPHARHSAHRSPGTGRALDQAAVLLSAALRLVVIFLACGALLVPFGAGFTSVLEVFARLAAGFEVGGINVSALAALRAVLAFAVVLALVKFIRSWLASSYLPTTTLQLDARDSVDKILRYLGIALAVVWALTAFGIGMEKVAILVSALSVGIGFGLQAITQNFVSGLILLVERPVKIGDWVRLGDVEGDIRRVNVRSTEIRVGDHSTMIVPNSELITKVVQNVTKGNALGRVQILLAIPLERDLHAAMRVARATLDADEATLDTPGPAVFVDKVEGATVVLNCFAHVKSPREAYGTRSRLILAILRDLKDQGIEVALPPQSFTLSPGVPGEAG